MAEVIMDRRKFLKSVPLTALAVASTGALATNKKGSVKPEDVSRFSPTALAPEFKIDGNGDLINNPDQRFALAKCFGCFNICAARLRIDNKTDEVLRVAGSPYGLTTSSSDPMPMNTTPLDAMKKLTGESGLANRFTLCARGNSAIDSIKDTHRITSCLKRAGKRGENKWVSISYEQLLKEVTEGGDLFNEGKVEGLKSIYNAPGYANDDYKDFGPAKNQLLVSACSEMPERWGFMKRFSEHSWATPNLGCKDSYCGHQQVAGCALGVEDGVNSGALPTTDYQHCEFAIFIGTNPGLSGISLNSASRRLADARTDRPDFKYVVIDPVLRAITSKSASDQCEWVPIKSGGDTALLHAMMQFIINNERFNAKYLASASQAGADKVGEKNFTNAPFLVVTEKSHALYNQFLTAEACGLKGDDLKMVIDKATGKMVTSDTASPCTLLFTDKVTLQDGTKLSVKTAFSLLKEQVNKFSMAHYSDHCQIPVKKIESLATEFTSHGERVSIETNTGCSATDGGQFAFSMIMLATLVGAHNAKGGMLHTGSMGYDNESPLYDLTAFNTIEPEGFNTERSGEYAQSDEYKQKVAKGINPYPANQAWTNTITQENTGELLIAHANKNPFQFKAWITWSNNPLYACSGLKDQVEASIQDPKQLGLIIAVDPFINETNINADYFVPDLVQYEQWDSARQWGSELMGSVVSTPVVTPKTVKTKSGNHVSMEQFIIDLSKELNLPGFGEQGFKDKAGKVVALNSAEDYYIPLLANLAHSGSVLPAPTAEDIKFTSVDRILPALKKRLKPEEMAATAYLLTRGGRYYSVDARYSGDYFSDDMRWDSQFQVFNETLARTIDSHSGIACSGTPIFDVDRFWDGSAVSELWTEDKFPFKLSTFKAHLQSNYSINLPRLTAMGDTNFIQMHEDDAKKVGLKHGDKARLLSPKGTSVIGLLQADKTVARGTIAVSMGFGHTAFGASDLSIDGTVRKAIKQRGQGMAMNPFNVVDPTRKGFSLYRDRNFGSTARHGVPIGIEKA